MKKKIYVLKNLTPTGPWLSDDDLKSDIAIQIGCPAYDYAGKLDVINIQFPAKSLRNYQQERGGYLVVRRSLIDDLMVLYLQSIEQTSTVPTRLVHPDYPEVHFEVITESTVRVMDDAFLGMRAIPGPVRYVAFLAVPKRFVLIKGDRR